MRIDLSQEELDIICGWYHAAAGESASGMSVSPREEYVEKYRYRYDIDLAHAKQVQALVDKFGFEYDNHDEYSLKRVGIIP